MPAAEFEQQCLTELYNSPEKPMHLGSRHSASSHEHFLWIKEGFHCLVFEKGCIVQKVKKDMSLFACKHFSN